METKTYVFKINKKYLLNNIELSIEISKNLFKLLYVYGVIESELRLGDNINSYIIHKLLIDIDDLGVIHNRLNTDNMREELWNIINYLKEHNIINHCHFTCIEKIPTAKSQVYIGE